MEPSLNTPPESVSRQNSQTLHITTRVADIQFTGMIASTGQCDSSDEDVVDAHSLRSPHDTCKIFSVSYIAKRIGYGSVKTEPKKFIFEFRQRPHPPQS